MLTHYVRIYLPTSNQPDVLSWTRTMAQEFGGCTAIPNGKGCWVNDKHELIEDDVTLLTSYCETITHAEVNGRDIAQRIRNMYKQDCVSMEVDGLLYFVSEERYHE